MFKYMLLILPIFMHTAWAAPRSEEEKVCAAVKDAWEEDYFEQYQEAQKKFDQDGWRELRFIGLSFLNRLSDRNKDLLKAMRQKLVKHEVVYNRLYEDAAGPIIGELYINGADGNDEGHVLKIAPQTGTMSLLPNGTEMYATFDYKPAGKKQITQTILLNGKEDLAAQLARLIELQVGFPEGTEQEYAWKKMPQSCQKFKSKPVAHGKPIELELVVSEVIELDITPVKIITTPAARPVSPGVKNVARVTAPL